MWFKILTQNSLLIIRINQSHNYIWILYECEASYRLNEKNQSNFLYIIYAAIMKIKNFINRLNYENYK